MTTRGHGHLCLVAINPCKIKTRASSHCCIWLLWFYVKCILTMNKYMLLTLQFGWPTSSSLTSHKQPFVLTTLAVQEKGYSNTKKFVRQLKGIKLLELDTRVGWRLVKLGVIVVLSQILLMYSFIAGKLAIPNSGYITIFLNGLVVTNQLENIFPMTRKVSSSQLEIIVYKR